MLYSLTEPLPCYPLLHFVEIKGSWLKCRLCYVSSVLFPLVQNSTVKLCQLKPPAELSVPTGDTFQAFFTLVTPRANWVPLGLVVFNRAPTLEFLALGRLELEPTMERLGVVILEMESHRLRHGSRSYCRELYSRPMTEANVLDVLV